LQLIVDEVYGCPRTVLELLMAATTARDWFWQVASPCLLMRILVGSEVLHAPILSATSGQFPLTEDWSENCTALPGGAAA